MNVTLIRYTPDPDHLAQLAASICTRREPTEKAMMTAVNSCHESILEHASFTFLAENVSRALLAQLTRHRIASFSVESQRYVNYEDGFGFVIPPSIEALGEEHVRNYTQEMEIIHAWYCGWVELLGKEHQEDARMVLPNAANTRLLFTMNGRELRHLLELRECNKAQWEIRQLARLVHEQVKKVAPLTFANAGPGCARGQCPESRPCGNPFAGGEDDVS